MSNLMTKLIAMCDVLTEVKVNHRDFDDLKAELIRLYRVCIPTIDKKGGVRLYNLSIYPDKELNPGELMSEVLI